MLAFYGFLLFERPQLMLHKQLLTQVALDYFGSTLFDVRNARDSLNSIQLDLKYARFNLRNTRLKVTLT